MEIGDWRLEIGDWRLESGEWRMDNAERPWSLYRNHSRYDQSSPSIDVQEVEHTARVGFLLS